MKKKLIKTEKKLRVLSLKICPIFLLLFQKSEYIIDRTLFWYTSLACISLFCKQLLYKILLTESGYMLQIVEINIV